jgi:hypothetical protein
MESGSKLHHVEGWDVTFGSPSEGSFGDQLLAPLVYKGTLCLGISVVDTESDPVRSEFICRIRIRNRIRNKSFRIRIRAALIPDE